MTGFRATFLFAGLVALSACAATNSGWVARAQSPDWVSPFPEAERPNDVVDTPEQTANKRAVLTFYELAYNAKDHEAAGQFLAPDFIQHGPTRIAGRDDLVETIRTLAHYEPESRRDVKRVMLDGDYVLLHAHLIETPDARGSVVGDIYRMENGLIAQHWSVVHPITGTPHPDNPNWVF